MELVNPHTKTIVRASGEVADRLIALGFTPVTIAPVPAKRGAGRPKKK